MRSEEWHPPHPERMARIGFVTTLLLIPLVLLDVAHQGADVAVPAVAGGLAAGVVGSLLALTVVATRRRGGVYTAAFYVWVLVAIASLAVVVVAAGGDPRRYGVLYGLAVAMFAVNFPAKGQVLLQPAAIASYAVALLAADLEPTEVAVQLGVAAILGAIAIEASIRIRSSSRAEREARTTAERQTGLATALSRLTSLDHDELMDHIVDAVVDLGFEVAVINVLEDGHLVPARHRGTPMGCEPYPIPADRGLAGVAVSEHRTAAVADYQEFEGRLPDRDGIRAAVAVPLIIRGQTVGVLVGASHVPGMPRSSDIEALEVLATHAGHAIVNATRFESERRTVARLTELEAMKSSFVSNVSHELRTPLTVIHGVGETLALHGDALDEERRRDLLARLNANSERLGAMIAALLDFSRFEAGAAEVSPTPVVLQPVIASLLRRLEPTLEGHHVSTDVADETVLVDPRLFEHVIENLVGNALRHTPPGTRVELRAAREGELARISIVDDGPGIARSELARITERFYRGHSGSGAGGVGLGLALCEQILAAHGTSLEVRSELGVGTEFSFVLPLAIPAPLPGSSGR